ncbi:hypothetical protein [uncultured Sphingomonas sp.]|uniref:hypothetical protein n=1 Tax=uncultured Sphingomonas sp. TaxID=158754 RepID=UPI0035C9DC39
MRGSSNARRETQSFIGGCSTFIAWCAGLALYIEMNLASLFTLLLAVLADYRVTRKGWSASNTSPLRSAPASGSRYSRLGL